jgi:pimeloyl-ACP methyl ester carboxylesterase
VSFASPVPEYSVEGSGPLLIYIAGLDGTGQLFFKQCPDLARTYRVVTFTLRETGRFTYDDLSDDVAAIINDLGEGRAIVVGESFGGTVALCFAIRHGDLVEKLVIVNSFPRFRGRLRIKSAIFLVRLIPFPLIWPWRFISNTLGLHLDGVTGGDRKRAQEIMRTVNGEGYFRRLELIEELDIQSQIREIRAPVLFIAGDKDLLIPSAREAYLMASLMPNATVKIVKGAGHACLLGSRVSLAKLLSDWEAEVSANRAGVNPSSRR